MQTLAFYSYKGGVGRSLLLANAARFLAMAGKRVVAIDLDLEAPGLHYKLTGAAAAERPADRPMGVAAYLLDAVCAEASAPPALIDHLLDIPIPPDSKGLLRLMPAGPAPERTYWATLKHLADTVRLDDPSGDGPEALLDLQARIHHEVRPDYLLIDARTGITELGGLATTILADTVVCLFVANQESVEGTAAVLDALRASKRLRAQQALRIVPVLARATPWRDPERRFIDGVRPLARIQDSRFVASFKRLVELGEVQRTDRQNPTPFVLPHDDIHGARDAVVAGERTASAFSPLHRAYLDLFRHLFPDARDQAERVMNRLEAVAHVRGELTEELPRPSPLTMAFSPWKHEDIAEGQVVETSGGQERYADLVCYGKDRQPLMVVEYVGGGSAEEARTAWNNLRYAGLKCLVLVDRIEGGQVSTTVFTEHPKEHHLRPTERWNLPRPYEFQLLRDVGDLSVDSMLDALHKGHPDYLQPLVHHWQRSISVGPHGGGPWNPEVARRILDGLAATEDGRAAVLTLMHAAPDPHHREYHGVRGMEAEIERWTEEELFAPLFWRLPVEGAFLYDREHRMGLPILAGHKLLAEEVMGLCFEPYRTFRKETDTLARRVQREHLRQLKENYSLHDLYHLWRRVDLKYAPSQTAPKALFLDGLAATGWHADKPREDDHAAEEWAGQLLRSRERLGEWIAGRIARREMITNGLLGSYDPASGTLSLHTEILEAAAPLLGTKLRHLRSVVFIHVSVLAYAHQARDLDGLPGHGFAMGPSSDPFHPENEAHVVIAQYFVSRLLQRLEDANLSDAFEKLSDRQGNHYNRWRSMQHVPLERMRSVLMRARSSNAAVGLNDVGDLA